MSVAITEAEYQAGERAGMTREEFREYRELNDGVQSTINAWQQARRNRGLAIGLLALAFVWVLGDRKVSAIYFD